MIKLALPAGDLRAPVAEVLDTAGLHVDGYGEGSRLYRLEAPDRPDVAVRVFREKDIPIQIALGNYDIGICSLAWVQEIQARFPEQPVALLGDLAAGEGSIYVAAARSVCEGLADLGRLPIVRIVSEYPNLAEKFARAARLRRYRVQSVWGAAEAYPPEDADVAVLSAGNEEVLGGHGLQTLHRLLDNRACLIANADALARRDLSSVLSLLASAASQNGHGGRALMLPAPVPATLQDATGVPEREVLRLAIPDGHQQRHVVDALNTAGLRFQGYDETTWVRRPVPDIDGLEVKVVRPHDMPHLVATGEIDIAITGRDCLNEHLYSFPSSPAYEIIDLQRAQYNLSAVVTEALPAETIEEALEHWRREGRDVIRVAAEFPAHADHYARSRHLRRYQIIPIAGASEGFVPEDAEILIEGTETGTTIKVNKLKVIDHLYRSTSAVIARRGDALSGRRGEVFDMLTSALSKAGERQTV